MKEKQFLHSKHLSRYPCLKCINVKKKYNLYVHYVRLERFQHLFLSSELTLMDNPKFRRILCLLLLVDNEYVETELLTSP